MHSSAARIVALLAVLLGARASAEDSPCLGLDDDLVTLTQKAQAGERGLWPRLQRLQKRYPGRCDDGYFAEGYSEFVTYVLAHRWDQTGELAKLVRNDRALLSFVLGHIDATASADNLSVVAKNARERCPKAAPRALCAAISKKAESALSVQ